MDKPDFANLKPVSTPITEKPDFANLKPVSADNTPTQKSGQGFWGKLLQDTVQGISKPFLEIGVSAGSLGAITAEGVSGLVTGGVGKSISKMEEASKDISKQGVDMGYFGNIKPIGADQSLDFSENRTNLGQLAFRDATQIISDGANVASWFVGLGEEKATSGAIEETTAQIGKTEFWSKLGTWFKKAAPFSLLQGLGVGTESLSKGKGFGESTGDAISNVAGNLAGFALFDASGNLFKRFGGSILKSKVIASANTYLLDSLSKVIGTDVRNLTPTAVKEISNKAQEGLTKLVSGVSDVIKVQGHDIQSVFDNVTEKMRPYFQNFYEKTNDAFKKFYETAPNVEGFPKTSKLLKDKADYLKNIGQNVLDTTGMPPARQKLISLMGSGITGETPKNIGEFVGNLLNRIGNDGKGTLSAKEIQMFVDQASILPSKDEQNLAGQITASLREDMTSFYKSKPETEAFSTIYRQAQQKASEVSHLFEGEGSVLGKLKKVGQYAPEILQNIINGKEPSPEVSKIFLDSLGGEGSGLQKDMSGILYNYIIDLSQKSTDLSSGSKLIRDFIDNWGKTGIINPEHINALSDFSDLMSHDTKNFIDIVQRFTGSTPELINKAKETTTQKFQLEASKTLINFLENSRTPLIQVSKDGTYDLTNLLQAMKSVKGGSQLSGTGEKLTSIIQEFESLNPQDVTESKVKAVVRSGLGALLLKTGHTWWGLSSLGGGLTTLLSSDGRISAIDAAEAVGELIGKVDKKGNPYLTPTFWTNLVSGNYSNVTKAIKILEKSMASESGKVTNKIKDSTSQ